MLREMGVRGKKIASSPNGRETERSERGIHPVNLGAPSTVFASVQRLVEFIEIENIVQPVRGLPGILDELTRVRTELQNQVLNTLSMIDILILKS